MKLVDRRDAKIIMDKDGTLGRSLHDSAEVSVIHIELAPGAVIAPHGDRAAILNFFKTRQKLHPVDVAVPECDRG